MAKLMKLINGVLRAVTCDGEVAVSLNANNAVVTFPAALNGGNSTPKVIAWFINTTDANPQFQDVEVTARSSTGFTATWNAPLDSANYKLAYAVLDGWVV